MADDSIDTLERATQPPDGLSSMMLKAPVIGAPQNPQPFISYLRSTLPANYAGNANANRLFNNPVVPQNGIPSAVTLISSPIQTTKKAISQASKTAKPASLTLTQSDVHATRALDTVYQNTTGLPLYVVLWVSNSLTGGTLTAYCDANSSPSYVCAEQSIGSNSFNVARTLTFFVPAGYYYKAHFDVANTGISWTEYTLSGNAIAGSQGAIGPAGPAGANGAVSSLTTTGSSGAATLVSGVLNVPIYGGGAGSLVLLEQHSASSSTELDFTAWYSSSYDEYIVELVNLVPATNLVNVLLRMSTNGGSTYDSGTNYEWVGFRASKGGSAAAGATGATAIGLDASGLQSSSTTTGGLCGAFRLFQPGNTTFAKRIKGEISINDGTANPDVVVMISGQYTVTASAVNAFQIIMSSGNIASGTVRIYGLTH